MSTAEMKSFVDHASDAEKRFMFSYLVELLNPITDEQIAEWDRRALEMEAGKSRVTWADFEKRLDGSVKK